MDVNQLISQTLKEDVKSAQLLLNIPNILDILPKDKSNYLIENVKILLSDPPQHFPIEDYDHNFLHIAPYLFKGKSIRNFISNAQIIDLLTFVLTKLEESTHLFFLGVRCIDAIFIGISTDKSVESVIQTPKIINNECALTSLTKSKYSQ